MTKKFLLVLFFFSIVLLNDSRAFTITSFSISTNNLTTTPTIVGNNAVNLNQTGTTNITYYVGVTRGANERGINLTFSLGTVLGSGSLYTFGGTYAIGDFIFDGAGVNSIVVTISNSYIASTEPRNNQLVLLFSDHSGPFQLYTGNSYLTNYPVAPLPFYRYYNPTTGFHFYSMDPTEVGSNPAWTPETTQGTTYNQQVSGTVPLYRYYNPTSGDHFYSQIKTTISGYNYQEIAAFVYSSQVSTAIPLYRYYDSLTGDHYYTSSYGGATSGDYHYETIACYILPLQ